MITSLMLKRFDAPRHGQRGLGLVELMVALLLGLLVTGSAVAIFASNRQTYAAAESIGRIQENARIAYEQMARDLRAAGGTACASSLPTANVTYDTTGSWWQTWSGGIVGYKSGDTNAPSEMKSGTNAIMAMTADDSPIPVVSHDPSGSKFNLNAKPTGYSGLDIAVVCDYRQASIFQIANNGVSGKTISYIKGGLNCSKDLSMPTKCSSTSDGVKYGNNAMLSRLRAVQWYVADSGRKNNLGNTIYSLYQKRRLDDGTMDKEEVAEGVSDMQLTYLVSGGSDYVNSASVGVDDWKKVLAVRIAITMQGGEGQGNVATSGGAFTRTLDHTVAIRNHSK